MKRYIMEFLGTFFLVLAIITTGNPLAIGFMFAAMIYIGIAISGAHYNPAVSLAAFMRKHISLTVCVGHILSQLLGAFAAAALFYLLAGKIHYPVPAADLALWKSIIIEILGTFVLASVTLIFTDTEKLRSSQLGGLIAGFTLIAIAFIGGPFSGGAFNPATALGPIAFEAIKGGNAYLSLPIYLIGPCVGGALAALVRQFFTR